VRIFRKVIQARQLSRGGGDIQRVLAKEISIAIEYEYNRLEDVMASEEESSKNEAISLNFEKVRRQSLDQICRFITRLLGLDESNIQDNQRVSPNWIQIKKLMDGVAGVGSPKVRLMVNEIEQTCIYHAEMANAGYLLMLPENDMKSTNSYRAYLLGNKINGDLDWGWEKDNKTLRELADECFSHFLALVVVTIHDKVGPGKVLTAACLLAVALSVAWETAPERARFE
jgi:hypothetical protein